MRAVIQVCDHSDDFSDGLRWQYLEDVGRHLDAAHGIGEADYEALGIAIYGERCGSCDVVSISWCRAAAALPVSLPERHGQIILTQ